MHTLTELDEYFKTLKKMRETEDPKIKQIYKDWLDDYLYQAKRKQC
jgi:coproporphyrinogen III oxidase